MNSGLEHTQPELSDDNVKEMLLLAERLREQHGGELDDSAILAVAEATGAPADYVRLAVRLIPDKPKHGLFHRMRTQVLTLEPEVRTHVAAGFLGTVAAAFSLASQRNPSGEELYGALMLLCYGVGAWTVSMSRDAKTAGIAGALFGGAFFLAKSLFHLLLGITGQGESVLLIPYVLGGAFSGFFLHRIVDRYKGRLGIEDPVQERQKLLRQLVDLQEKLRSGEQSMTFLSVDVVGSTRIKELSDPLSVEFTFTEYHNFVEMVARRYGGRLHSTAGDGMTCAFDHPQQAFGAARNIQTGIIELNTHRNKTGMPLVLRAGIHTGNVVAPNAADVTSVNFAHVIDISAHLQKVCPPGGVVISEAAANKLPGGADAIGTERVEAMSVPGRVWQPRQAMAAGSSSTPPPFER
jgi:class 3 adenylate cyclase